MITGDTQRRSSSSMEAPSRQANTWLNKSNEKSVSFGVVLAFPLKIMMKISFLPSISQRQKAAHINLQGDVHVGDAITETRRRGARFLACLRDIANYASKRERCAEHQGYVSPVLLRSISYERCSVRLTSLSTWPSILCGCSVMFTQPDRNSDVHRSPGLTSSRWVAGVQSRHTT